MPALTRFEQLLCRFAGCGVKFVLIGGEASSIHGSSRATFDLDLVYNRSDESLTRVVDALVPLHPYLRGAPLLQESMEVHLADDVSIQVADLNALIWLKSAAGRARDLEAVAELLRIREERKRISE